MLLAACVGPQQWPFLILHYQDGLFPRISREGPTIYFLQTAEVSVSLVQTLSQCRWHSDSQDVHDSHSQAFCLLVL